VRLKKHGDDLDERGRTNDLQILWRFHEVVETVETIYLRVLVDYGRWMSI